MDKKKQKIVTEWIARNGAATFDLKEGNILLHDGGLFYIEKKKYLGRKIIGKKKLPNGYFEILFSKKKCVPRESYIAYLWIEELDETINYFKRMKGMLRKIGFDTGRSLHPKKSLIKKLNKIKNERRFSY